MYLFEVVTFLITFFAWKECDAQTCPSRWFGEHCMYRCMCYNDGQCDSLGNCPGGWCLQTYFGPACQFLDPLMDENLPTVANYLKDNNKATCNPDQSASTVQLYLRKAIPFMWLRIEVKDERHINSFSVLLNNTIPCYNQQVFRGIKTMDISCANQDLTGSITISGPVARDVCSIYISAGRNLALHQNVTMSSSMIGSFFSKPEWAVDNNANGDFDGSSCVHTNIEEEPWVSIAYNRPVYILHMYLHNRDGVFADRIRFFNVQFLNIRRKKFYQYNDRTLNVSATYHLTGNITSQTIEVVISGYNFSVLGWQALHFCEFKSLGEAACPEGTYGLWCEQKCQCQDVGVCNPVTGVCAGGCQPGFYGRNCTTPCSTCLDGFCTNLLGKCFLCIAGKTGVWCENDCRRGFYGLNCSMPCSVICIDGLCAPSDGQCYRCPAGLIGGYCENVCPSGHYGFNCSMLCGDSCKGGICKETNGKCVECFTGYEGEYCENDCQAGFYGDNCESNCSKHCKKACDHLDGNCSCRMHFAGATCLDCADGRYGVDCGKKCSITCTDLKCDNITGACFSCYEGYSGTFCGAAQESSGSVGKWLMFMLLMTGLTVAVGGTLLLRTRIDNAAAE